MTRSAERYDAFRELRLVDGKPETGRAGQSEEPAGRIGRIVEHGMSARRRVVPLARLGGPHLGRGDVKARLMADRRLRLVRHQLDAMRLTERLSLFEPGNAAHLDDVRLDHADAGRDE